MAHKETIVFDTVQAFIQWLMEHEGSVLSHGLFNWRYTGTSLVYKFGDIRREYFRIENVTGLKYTYEVEQKPSYAQEQAQWVKDNNVRIGDKVKVLRGWEEGEQGFDVGVNDAIATIGRTDTINGFSSIGGSIGLVLSSYYRYPYFVLELIKEPVYVPYTKVDLKWIDKIVKTKDGNGVYIITGVDQYYIEIGNKTYTPQRLFHAFVWEDGSVCGEVQK